VSAALSNGTAQRLTHTNDKEAPFFIAGESGPAVSTTEERRHVYLRDRSPVRIKIKRRSGQYTNWYRVTRGNIGGWQAGKPEDFVPFPYTGAFDAFDPEFQTEPLYWPEGEKDCDTLSQHGLPAFTFGGTGDGLPRDIASFLSGRDIIILADNDSSGKSHAVDKAKLAHSSGAANIKIIEFPELAPKSDVSDFLSTKQVKDLEDRVSRAAPWEQKPQVTHVRRANASWLLAICPTLLPKESIGFGRATSRSGS
jgi:hypothetical protein